AVLAHAFPGAKERAGALAAYGATIGGAFAIGPAVVGALTSGLDWQWIFLINVPLGIACLWITRAKVEESRDPAAPRVDWPGQATLTAGLFLLVLALLRGNEDGWGSTFIVASLAGAAVLLAAFVAVEARSDHPMVPLRLFRNTSFTGAQAAAFAISASFFAVFLYTTLYLQQVLGLSAIEAGLVYLPGTMVGGLALVAVGMALLTLADATSSWTIVLPGSIIAMIGTGLFNPSVTAVARGSVPGGQSGLAAGVNDTFRQGGIAVGVAALGALVPAQDAFGGSADAYVGGLQDARWAGAALAMAGALAALWLIRMPARNQAVALPA